MGGGSPSTTTTTVDPVYNAGLLKLSQEQQGWAAEMYNQFKYGVPYDPNEKVTGAYVDGKWVNQADLPTVTQQGRSGYSSGLNPNLAKALGIKPDQEPKPSTVTDPKYNIKTLTRGDVEGYDPEAQTSEMEYLQNLVNANQSLLGLQTEVSKQGLGVQKERLGLASTFLGDINKGIDVGSRMDEAQAGVQHGFKLARKASQRNISSYGLDPNSSLFASQNRDLALAEAGGIAGARTGAKNLAEQEDFERKKTGLTINY